MGLASLVCEKGTGKTLLLECLRESLWAAQIPCVFLRDARISTNRFFETIASELGLRCEASSAYQVFSALHQLTQQQAQKGRTVAMLIDQAHDLPGDVLNEVLHLASLHEEKIKLLQTVLAGRPELHATVDALNLERLKQHAVLNCELGPFTARETGDYIEFRLARAGMPKQTVFPPDAMAEIYARSRGFAPEIHTICEGLLLAAFSARSKVLTPELLDQVLGKPGGQQSAAVGASATVVEVTGIDLARVAPPADPEPPAMRSTLLRLADDAIPASPPFLPWSVPEPRHARGSDLHPVIPITPFELAKDDPPPPETTRDFETPQVNLPNPAGPTLADLTSAYEPEQGRLLPLASRVKASAPPARKPIQTFSCPLQSLYLCFPVAKIQPLNPRNCWLLLANWKPAETPAAGSRTAAPQEMRQAFSLDRRWLLLLAVPMLAALTLYGGTSGMRTVTQAVNDGWRRRTRRFSIAQRWRFGKISAPASTIG